MTHGLTAQQQLVQQHNIVVATANNGSPTLNNTILSITLGDSPHQLLLARQSDGGEEGEEQRNWAALGLSILIAATVAGNVMVCVAVCGEQRLHNMTNFFLMSLAIADLMVALLVMPMALVVTLYGYFPLSDSACLLWASADVLMCTASIWHMCTLSVDRYFTLKYPMRCGRHKTKRTVAARIVFVWLVSIVVSCPVAAMGLDDVSTVYDSTSRQCAPTSTKFVIYGSVLAFYVPLAINIVTYTLTIRILWRNQRNILRMHDRSHRAPHTALSSMSTRYEEAVLRAAAAAIKDEMATATAVDNDKQQVVIDDGCTSVVKRGLPVADVTNAADNVASELILEHQQQNRTTVVVDDGGCGDLQQKQGQLCSKSLNICSPVDSVTTVKLDFTAPNSMSNNDLNPACTIQHDVNMPVGDVIAKHHFCWQQQQQITTSTTCVDHVSLRPRTSISLHDCRDARGGGEREAEEQGDQGQEQQKILRQTSITKSYTHLPWYSPTKLVSGWTEQKTAARTRLDSLFHFFAARVTHGIVTHGNDNNNVVSSNAACKPCNGGDRAYKQKVNGYIVRGTSPVAAMSQGHGGGYFTHKGGVITPRSKHRQLHISDLLDRQSDVDAYLERVANERQYDSDPDFSQCLQSHHAKLCRMQSSVSQPSDIFWSDFHSHQQQVTQVHLSAAKAADAGRMGMRSLPADDEAAVNASCPHLAASLPDTGRGNRPSAALPITSIGVTTKKTFTSSGDGDGNGANDDAENTTSSPSTNQQHVPLIHIVRDSTTNTKQRHHQVASVASTTTSNSTTGINIHRALLWRLSQQPAAWKRSLSRYILSSGSIRGTSGHRNHRSRQVAPSRRAVCRAAKNERKALRVLGIIFVVFVMLWTPFFVVNVITAAPTSNSAITVDDSSSNFEDDNAAVASSSFSQQRETAGEYPSWLHSTPVALTTMWLGYLSSLANPVIYTVFSTHFRQAFYRIVSCSLHRRRHHRHHYYGAWAWGQSQGQGRDLTTGGGSTAAAAAMQMTYWATAGKRTTHPGTSNNDITLAAYRHLSTAVTTGLQVNKDLSMA